MKATQIKTILLSVLLMTCSHQALASGFEISEQNASGLGNAYAGGAASAEDASTIWYNPAGMSRLEQDQFVGAIDGIATSVKFSDRGSQAPTGKSLGNDGEDAGKFAPVPSLYFMKTLGTDWRVGFGVNSPFGLATDYNGGWMGRYQAQKSSLMTINLNPNISYKINDMFSVGVGLDAQYAKAKLTNAVNFSSAVPDGFVVLKGDSWGFGGNVGVMAQITPTTRVGVSYHSTIDHTLKGDATFDRPTGVSFSTAPDGAISADLPLPDILSVSIFHELTPQWDLMADIKRVGWSRFKELKVVYSDTGTTLQQINENWDDTYRFAAGASYKYDNAWKFRLGSAYEQTPVPDSTRTARIPDESYVWLSAGASYSFGGQHTIDVGYSHLFVWDASINNLQGTGATDNGNLVGTYKASTDIFGIQYTRTF